MPIVIKNLVRSSIKEDEYYEGPSLREAVLSMAQDLYVVRHFDSDEEMSLRQIFSELLAGDYFRVLVDSELEWYKEQKKEKMKNEKRARSYA